MSDGLIFHLGSAIAMFVVIAFSFYMVRSTRGRMSEGFKIILMGHVPLMLLHTIEAAMILFSSGGMSELKLDFLEQTAQVIAALSIFAAIYIIRRTLFMDEDAEHEV
ncbi:Uncharacterised protein [uncultured archaeon]|nr:Uncharacterised protein [uncultured archaeon]